MKLEILVYIVASLRIGFAGGAFTYAEENAATLPALAGFHELGEHLTLLSPEKENGDADESWGHSENGTVAQTGGVENIVELLIVCDKDFGDAFKLNYKSIVDYWTVIMWDLNNRFQTLEKVKVSFRTVGVVVATNRNSQSFVEDARDQDTDEVDMSKMVDNFPSWADKNRNALPKYDLVLIATKAKLVTAYRSITYKAGVCQSNTNIVALNEFGKWNTIINAAAAIGVNLGGNWESNTGYVMGGENTENRFFFSQDGDKDISNFVGSCKAKCLRSINEPNRLAISVDYERPLAPSADAQCKRLLESDSAFVQKIKDVDSCKKIECIFNKDNRYTYYPLDNTPCGEDKRCFRGRCREQGHLLKNVGSGLCVRAANPFSYAGPLEMYPCPKVGSPQDRFVFKSNSSGITLSAPFMWSQDGSRKMTGDMCMYAFNWDRESYDNTPAWVNFCDDFSSSYYKWNLTHVGNAEFLLFHKDSERCLRPESYDQGSRVVAESICDEDNQLQRWTMYL